MLEIEKSFDSLQTQNLSMKKASSSATLLLVWYRKHGRPLPWRETRNPYHILVSEIMLQQTQVSRGLIFYDRWIQLFPNWKTLSKATNAEVIVAWSGLGYNRRALMLRDSAKQVIANGIPQSESDWKKIKGIGPYTAAAISAFAQKKRVMPIDTNIRRVLGRFLLGIPFPQLSDDKRLEHKMDSFLPKRGHYYDVPQALFDLATMLCTKTPNCKECPLRASCKVSTRFLFEKIKTPKRMNQKAKEKKHAQKPFPNRIYRGRIIKLVKQSSNGFSLKKIGQMIDPNYDPLHDREWLMMLITRLIKEGFLTQHGNHFF